jgi:hypothetical protein
MPFKNSFHLPAGHEVSLVASANFDGYYVRTAPGGTRYTPTFVSASATVVVGPFNEPRDFEIASSNGSIAVGTSVPSGVFTAVDDGDVIHSTNDVSDLTPLGEANLADIANDATGTAIATAVNGVLAILLAAGLMDAPEVP